MRINISPFEMFEDFGCMTSCDQADTLEAIGRSLDDHATSAVLTMQAKRVSEKVRKAIRPEATRAAIVVLHQFLTAILEDK